MTRRTLTLSDAPPREHYKPAPYTGNGLEVIENLTSSTNSSKVLAEVAFWHEAPYRRGRRHQVIAAALRTASGTRPKPANDNQARNRRVA